MGLAKLGKKNSNKRKIIKINFQIWQGHCQAVGADNMAKALLNMKYNFV
jgi:hypothetical protein